MTEIATLITALGVVALGMAAYVLIAWRARPTTWTLGTFFLGGRNVGAVATGSATWGTAFSFANGIYYFAYLGFDWGMVAVWVQVPWLLSIVALAYFAPTIMQVTERHTLHGVIGSLFGSRARTVASVVTLIGFFGALGFEIYVTVNVLAKAAGAEGLTLALAVLLALFAAAYCDIGGFKGTVRTDGAQNVMGMLGLVILVVLALVLLTGSAGPADAVAGALASTLSSGGATPMAVCGVIFFATFVNLVDMSNWQNIAANGGIRGNDSEIRKLRKGIIGSGLLMLVFPCLVGTFIGWLTKVYVTVPADGDGTATFLTAVYGATAFPSLVAGSLLGLVVLAILGIALSTIDSYLLISSQVITWDFGWRRSLDEVSSVDDLASKEQRKIVQSARLSLYSIATLATLGFAALVAMSGGNAFVLQFAIFGLMLSLVPSVLYGLIWYGAKYSESSQTARRVLKLSCALSSSALFAIGFFSNNWLLAVFGGVLSLGP